MQKTVRLEVFALETTIKLPSGMYHRLVWWKYTNDSEERAASSFKKM